MPAACYDPQRETARLALIELQSRLSYEQDDLASYLDGTRYPGLVGQDRDRRIAKIGQTITERQHQIRELSAVVGDPEAVIDSDGLFPAERRKLMLEQHEDLRTIAVIALRRQVRESQAGIAAAADRATRAQHRAELRDATRRLDNWLCVGPLTAEDMCSECPTPIAQHGWVTPPTDGPCRAWPQWAARVAEARELLLRAVASGGRSVARPPEPEPVAVIASGLPIGEIIDQLTDIRRRYPESVVRRGRANRWEIWPAVGSVSTSEPAAAGYKTTHPAAAKVPGPVSLAKVSVDCATLAREWESDDRRDVG